MAKKPQPSGDDSDDMRLEVARGMLGTYLRQPKSFQQKVILILVCGALVLGGVYLLWPIIDSGTEDKPIISPVSTDRGAASAVQNTAPVQQFINNGNGSMSVTGGEAGAADKLTPKSYSPEYTSVTRPVVLEPFHILLTKSALSPAHYNFVHKLCRHCNIRRIRPLQDFIGTLNRVYKHRKQVPQKIKDSISHHADIALSQKSASDLDLVEIVLLEIQNISEENEDAESLFTDLLLEIEVYERDKGVGFPQRDKLAEIIEAYADRKDKGNLKELVRGFMSLWKTSGLLKAKAVRGLASNGEQKIFDVDCAFTGSLLRKLDPGCSANAGYSFDPLGRLTSIQNGENLLLSITYDRESRVIRRVAGEIETKYIYNKSGLLASTEDSGGSRVSYSYDTKGNLEKVFLARGFTASYAYDALGRMTSRTLSNVPASSCSHVVKNSLITGQCREFVCAYDAAARSTRTANSDFIYDDHGNIIMSILSDGGAPTIHYYSYDLAGRRISSVQELNPAGLQRSIEYGYDEFGRINRVHRIERMNLGGLVNCPWKVKSLLIGANSTQNGMRIKYARNDAIRMFAELSASGDGQHLLLADGLSSRGGFLKLLGYYDTTDCNLVYFSGHGTKDRSGYRLLAISDGRHISEKDLKFVAPNSLLLTDSCSGSAAPLTEFNSAVMKYYESTGLMFESDRTKGGIFTDRLLSKMGMDKSLHKINNPIAFFRRAALQQMGQNNFCGNEEK